MKISKSVRDIYAEQRPTYEELKRRADEAVLHLEDTRWHYESRVKELESFALKLETGRIRNPSEMEDFSLVLSWFRAGPKCRTLRKGLPSDLSCTRGARSLTGLP